MKFTFSPESKPLDGYTIKRAIDKGGFGEVYYAISDAGKEVALKLLRENLEIELRGIRQCLNLKHPHLVTIFDIKVDEDGDHWIVMEFVSGKTLFDTIRQHSRGMPVEEIEHWLTSIASGLDFLHERGIVHRDLKPANIFEEDGIVKIGDVGLSKFISESQRGAQTQSVGTVYYMAPEISRGQYGREIDVYSLGVMLYEMLTGSLPFQGDTPGEILMKQLTERPDLNRVPERFRTVLAGALEKDPLVRTATAGELLEQFKAAARGESPKVAREQPKNNQEKLREEVKRAAHNHRQHQEKSPKYASPTSHEEWADWVKENWFYLAIAGGILLLFMPRAMAALITPIMSMGGFVLSFGLLVFVGYKVYSYIAEEETKRQQAKREAEKKKPASPVFQNTYRKSEPPKSKVLRTYLTPDTVRNIPASVRFAELFSSLGLATVFTALLTGTLYYFTDAIASPVQAAAYGLSALLASWVILTEAKILEGRKIDGTIRRVRMLVLGGLAGVGVYWVNTFLMIPLDSQMAGGVLELSSKPLIKFGSDNLVQDFAVFFAALFALRRWWWHVDSFRSARVRVWSLLGTFLLAMFLPMIVSFSWEMSVLLATGISAIVQLSASWTPPRERAELAAAANRSFPDSGRSKK